MNKSPVNVLFGGFCLEHRSLYITVSFFMTIYQKILRYCIRKG